MLCMAVRCEAPMQLASGVMAHGRHACHHAFNRHGRRASMQLAGGKMAHGRHACRHVFERIRCINLNFPTAMDARRPCRSPAAWWRMAAMHTAAKTWCDCQLKATLPVDGRSCIA
eukprot:364240-Chlamydomonas_euryale.AAC.3